MNDTVWKSFKFSDLFILDAGYNTKTSNKNLNISDTKGTEHNLLLINKGGTNNAEEGYIKKEPSYKTCSNGITMDDQFGNCFYHDSEFIMTGGGHINVVLCKSDKVKKIADSNIVVYHFIATMLRKIFQKTGIYGYMYKITDERPLREIILLPVMEVKLNENYIWEENGKYWTLDVDYIKTLMLEAKKRKEEKTIRFYEAERAKYEAERAKYEKGYLEEREVLVWKSFKLDELFTTITGRDSNIAQKNLDKQTDPNEEYNIAIITESTQNNGIGFYMKSSDTILQGKIVDKGITFGTQFGNSNFHDYRHFIIGNTNYLKPNSEKLEQLMDKYIGAYFSKTLNHCFNKSGLYGYGNKIDQKSFYREIILLPVLEVNSNEEHLWHENGKYWTLAKDTVSYLYIQGQIKIQQRKIDSYSHPY